MQTLRLSACAAVIVFSALTAGCCHDGEKRDPAQRRIFHSTHPCPHNGNTRGVCPGYQVDHIIAICLGGRDAPSNMQWLTIAQHQAKTAEDIRRCRKK